MPVLSEVLSRMLLVISLDVVILFIFFALRWPQRIRSAEVAALVSFVALVLLSITAYYLIVAIETKKLDAIVAEEGKPIWVPFLGPPGGYIMPGSAQAPIYSKLFGHIANIHLIFAITIFLVYRRAISAKWKQKLKPIAIFVGSCIFLSFVYFWIGGIVIDKYTH
jgi:hypothetical protein